MEKRFFIVFKKYSKEWNFDMAMTSYLDLCAEAVKKCRTAIFEFIKRLEDSLSETKS